MLYGEQPFAHVEAVAAGGDPAKRGEAQRMHVNLRKRGLRFDTERALDLSAHPRLIGVLERTVEHDMANRYSNAQLLYEDLKRVWEDDFPDEVKPVEESPDEQFAKLQREVDYHLRHGKYGDARKAAKRMAAADPTRAAAWLAAPAVSVAQADDAGKKGAPAFRDRFLKQAVKQALDGVERVRGAEQAEIMRYVADLYRRLGDARTAAAWSERARAANTEGAP